MFGQELRLPLDLATGRLPDEELPPTKVDQSSKVSGRGPFTVLEALSDVTYKINGGARRWTIVVHVDCLWAFDDPGPFTWDPGEDEEVKRDHCEENQTPSTSRGRCSCAIAFPPAHQVAKEAGRLCQGE